jgi:hypothetical protein
VWSSAPCCSGRVSRPALLGTSAARPTTPRRAVVSGSDAYWNESNGSTQVVEHCTLPACAATDTIPTTGSFPTFPVIVGSTLFYAEQSPGEILAVQLPASAPDAGTTTVWSSSAGGYGSLWGLTSDGTNLYWMTSQTTGLLGRLFSCVASNCAATATLIADRLFNPLDYLVSDSTNLYFWDLYGDLKMCPLPDCAGGPRVLSSVFLSPDGLYAGSGIFPAGAYLYASGLTNGVNTLYECAIANCAATFGAVATSVSGSFQNGIALAGKLYFGLGTYAIGVCSVPGCIGGVQPIFWMPPAYYTPGSTAASFNADATNIYVSDPGWGLDFYFPHL